MNFNSIIFSFLSLFSDRAALDSTGSKLIDTYNEQFKIYLNESRNNVINEKIEAGLDAFIETFLGQVTYQHYNLVATTASGELIGGLLSNIIISNKFEVGKSCYITNMWTNEEYMAQGLGAALIQKLTYDMKMQHCKCIYIEVCSADEYSKDFFETMGFSLNAVIPGPRDDLNFKVYHMSLNLDAIDISKIIINKINSCFMLSYTNYFSNLIHYKNISKINQQKESYIRSKVGSFQDNNFTIFTTLKSGKIVGGAICGIRKISNMFYCYVGHLWIDEQYRRHKLGSKIMKEVEKYAKIQHCPYIELDTDHARPFYEKLGFKVIASISDNNCFSYNTYFMRKEIS